MAKAEPGPRERMIVSTALLMRERGARATSLDAVLEHSGAPRGSVYHHFPGGREQLLREATDYAGEYVARRLERTAPRTRSPRSTACSTSTARASWRPTSGPAARSSPWPSSPARTARTCATTSWAPSTAGGRSSRAGFAACRDRRGALRRAGAARRRRLRGRADPQQGLPRPRPAREPAARDTRTGRSRARLAGRMSRGPGPRPPASSASATAGSRSSSTVARSSGSAATRPTRALRATPATRRCGSTATRTVRIA